MKIYRFPRWLSTVAFALGKPAWWFWNRTGLLGRFLRETQFCPASFECHYCRVRTFEIVQRRVYQCDNGACPARMCKACDGNIPF